VDNALSPMLTDGLRQAVRGQAWERRRHGLPPHRVSPLSERIVATPLDDGAIRVGERIDRAQVIDVHVLASR
jgi:hypothetical protein